MKEMVDLNYNEAVEISTALRLTGCEIPFTPEKMNHLGKKWQYAPKGAKYFQEEEILSGKGKWTAGRGMFYAVNFICFYFDENKNPIAAILYRKAAHMRQY